ncbi:hypothetical protein PtA15_5A26 [Puccinia triticina]|uniref:Uncharacterized protein n=1 Tax=Puccinia triticina TaxID=208348 RepID=A0ABY7CGV1_9BASI|nr:uncharacterized protein PtA15_5A26 [Puccinia triticina]WAQ84456.1 hypothetical protein PtA15_5A26 [Puccinia triticina]
MSHKTDRQHLHEEVKFMLVTSLWKMQMADCLSIKPFWSNPLNKLSFSFTKLAILKKMKFPDNVISQHGYLMLANFQYCQLISLMTSQELNIWFLEFLDP